MKNQKKTTVSWTNCSKSAHAMLQNMYRLQEFAEKHYWIMSNSNAVPFKKLLQAWKDQFLFTQLSENEGQKGIYLIHTLVLKEISSVPYNIASRVIELSFWSYHYPYSPKSCVALRNGMFLCMYSGSALFLWDEQWFFTRKDIGFGKPCRMLQKL